MIAVRTGTSEAAQWAAASHTAAAAPSVTRDALFGQAGVITVDTPAELVGTLAALTWQPLPSGNRVAVVTNAGGCRCAGGRRVEHANSSISDERLVRPRCARFVYGLGSCGDDQLRRQLACSDANGIVGRRPSDQASVI